MTAKTKDLDIYDLDLPVDPSFYAPPPRLNMKAYCEWCEEMYRYIPEREKNRPLPNIPEFNMD